MKIDSSSIIKTVKAMPLTLSKAPLLKTQQCDTVSISSKLSNAEISAILSNLASPNTKIDIPVLTGLLNKKSQNLINEFAPKGTSISETIRLLDVSRRRGHSIEYIKNILDNMTGAKNSAKVFNTLEFSDYDKAKDITLETFKELTYDEQKGFLNSIISMKTRFSSPKQIVEQLPDAAIFQEIKDIVPKNISKFQFGLPNAQYKEQAENTYNEIILSLLDQLQKKGKAMLPHSKMQLRPGRFLDIKPPLVDSIQDIKTKMISVNGYNIKTGSLPSDKRLMVHNLDEESFARLEALLLTNKDTVLCAGRTGGKGYLKGSSRPGIIISPKTPEDCLIQAKEDVSSGYGAVKNLYNIQSAFLTKENEANTYVPDLLRKRLNLTQEEYNKRISALCNTKYVEDIKNIDEEFYNAACDILDNEQMFEAIVRNPEIEAICLPCGYEISKTIARFAQIYNIPILFS